MAGEKGVAKKKTENDALKTTMLAAALDQIVSFVTQRQITAVVKTYMRNEHIFSGMDYTLGAGRIYCATQFSLSLYEASRSIVNAVSKTRMRDCSGLRHQGCTSVLQPQKKKSTAHRLCCRGQEKGRRVLIFLLK